MAGPPGWTIAAIVVGVAVWRTFDIGPARREARGMLAVFVVVGLVLLSMEVGVASTTSRMFRSRPWTWPDRRSSRRDCRLVWGAAGLAGMVAGAMRERREVWIGGAVVMGLVIVKLFVVEPGNVDTLNRVVSFLGVGLLLLVVGYVAPVPKGRQDIGEETT